MKKKIIFGLLCLLSLTTTVNAEELIEPFASIVKDGTLYVDTLVPTNESEFNSVKSILNEQYKEYLQDDETTTNKSLSLVDCSLDYSTCTLVYSSCLVEGCGDTPTEVSVTWKEAYSELFNKLAPNGTFEIKAITPTNDEELDFYVNSYFLSLYPDSSVYGYLEECNEDKSECNLSIVTYDENYESDTVETHKTKIVWAEKDTKIKEMVDSYIQKIESLRSLTEDGSSLYFNITDLNKINFMNSLHSKASIDDSNKAINYLTDLKKLSDNTNITYYLDMRLGESIPMAEFGFGGFILSYDGIIYGLIEDVGLGHRNVIYIPDETENTKEAYIEAAKKRIDEYLGNTNTKIEVAGERSSYTTEYEFEFSTLGDESKMGDYYYSITVGNITELFVIVRDSSKIEKPTYTTKDIETNITISTENTTIPLDTKIEVEEVITTSEVFTKINEVLKLEEKEEVQVYDFKLFSQTTNQYISKLESGEFKVSVPIKESLKGKELVAYYVTDNNEIEEHPVTVVDGIATFTTTHFSIYTIAEKRETEDPLDEEVPTTGDNVMTYITIGMIGVIGLGTGIVLRKREN